MLDQVRFEFSITTCSFLHVGEGKSLPLNDLRETASEKQSELVSTVQRDISGLPCIEASSIRGAMRAHLRRSGWDDADIERLFGPDEVEAGEAGEAGTAGSGKLWVRYGRLENAEQLSAIEFLLPDWLPPRSGHEARFAGTFILPGIRIGAETGTAANGAFYKIEFVPDGARFRFNGVWLGKLEEFEEHCGRLFAELACEGGFEIGGETGYGYGRAKLDPDSITFDVLCYEPRSKSFAPPKNENLAPPETRQKLCVPRAERASPTHEFTLVCEGPFFIQDPIRAKREGRADTAAMMRDAAQIVLSGKAILQDLRRRSAWIERLAAIEGSAGFNYNAEGLPKDDPGVELRPGACPSKLEITQRLFGVAGWKKLVSIRSVDISWDGDIHRAQGLKLDVFSQAPIDGALLEIEAPAGITATVRIDYDQRPYEKDVLKSRKRSDEEHLKKVIADLGANVRRARYGHSTRVGYGAFDYFQGAVGGRA